MAGKPRQPMLQGCAWLGGGHCLWNAGTSCPVPTVVTEFGLSTFHPTSQACSFDGKCLNVAGLALCLGAFLQSVCLAVSLCSLWPLPGDVGNNSREEACTISSSHPQGLHVRCSSVLTTALKVETIVIKYVEKLRLWEIQQRLNIQAEAEPGFEPGR